MRSVSRALRRLIFLLGFAGSLAAGYASANIIYTFSGVTFDDGGTLTGTFTTDDGISSLLDFDILTSGAVGFHYTPGTAGSSSTSLPFILVLSTPTLDQILQVTFTNLTATGSPITISIGGFASFEQTGLTNIIHRDITAGEVVVGTSLPEPSTSALAGISLLGLLWFVRRRRT